MQLSIRKFVEIYKHYFTFSIYDVELKKTKILVNRTQICFSLLYTLYQQEKKLAMVFFRSRGSQIFTSQHSQKHSAHTYFDFSKTRLRISPVNLSTGRRKNCHVFFSITRITNLHESTQSTAFCTHILRI